MMLANAVAGPPKIDFAKFNYVDIIAIVWLLIGLWRGRKRGLSQELLPTAQWIGIVVVCGLFYWPLSQFLRPYTKFTVLWSNISAYFLIAVGIHVIYLWFKQMLAAKLVEKDAFGRAEYYLGMVAGVVRFACMMLVAMALMNSRVATAAELAETKKFQERWFSDIKFPTYGEFQHDVIDGSFTGNLVEATCKSILIASVNSPSGGAPPGAPAKPQDSIAQKKNQEIDDILKK
jgi:uncharacterized membrane protein required for colicin V production